MSSLPVSLETKCFSWSSSCCGVKIVEAKNAVATFLSRESFRNALMEGITKAKDGFDMFHEPPMAVFIMIGRIQSTRLMHHSRYRMIRDILRDL